ncbi:MAG TPA: amylo-alpha-1,6-glucosidase [Thermoplasmata archaeon]|nr:amylo-alpha-1,6-glucosidase [Thermoplasmata archaeon]
MTDGAASGAAPAMFSTTEPRPDRPVLVAGLGSFAMMNGAGEFSFVRETRGADVEWGGAYAQSVRLTGAWRTQVSTGAATIELGRATLVSLEHGLGGTDAAHRFRELAIRDEVRPTLTDYGLCRSLSIRNLGGTPSTVYVEIAFEPFLAPVLMEGVKPHRYSIERWGPGWLVRSFGFGFAWEMDPIPRSYSVDGRPAAGVRQDGPISTISFRWEVDLPPGSTVELHARIAGGLIATARGDRACSVAAESRRVDYEREIQAWIGRTPTLDFPDAPELSTGYALARSALRSLYTAPDAAIAGLVAGYPWYPAIWGRDLAWMLPAVQWLGDAPWVERSLRSLFRFQTRSEIPVLGGTPGEIPMQVAPGPVFLYGTSDTTLYYPRLVRGFADHTGSLSLARDVFPNLRRAIDWGVAKTRGPLGLIANGGEVAAMKQETEIGRVRVGFDAVDTTIWDSTDRRDHAIDLQVLWCEALESIASLATETGIPPPDRIAGRAERLRGALSQAYRWPEEGYLYDSLRADGTPVAKVRPNALRAVRPGMLPKATAEAIVRRAAQDDLTTPWGVRTLSNRDPTYDPRAYHDGQVWTIATAWAAEAALWADERELGVAYLRTNARRLIEEGGYAAECYRGDRPAPFDACFLLGFSVAPFLTNLFESLWGISPRMSIGTVDVRPRFPTDWHAASMSGLSLGAGTFSLNWTPGRLEATWSGPGSIELTGGTAAERLRPGVPGTVEIPRDGEG